MQEMPMPLTFTPDSEEIFFEVDETSCSGIASSMCQLGANRLLPLLRGKDLQLIGSPILAKHPSVVSYAKPIVGLRFLQDRNFWTAILQVVRESVPYFPPLPIPCVHVPRYLGINVLTVKEGCQPQTWRYHFTLVRPDVQGIPLVVIKIKYDSEHG